MRHSFLQEMKYYVGGLVMKVRCALFRLIIPFCLWGWRCWTQKRAVAKVVLPWRKFSCSTSRGFFRNDYVRKFKEVQNLLANNLDSLDSVFWWRNLNMDTLNCQIHKYPLFISIETSPSHPVPSQGTAWWKDTERQSPRLPPVHRRSQCQVPRRHHPAGCGNRYCIDLGFNMAFHLCINKISIHIPDLFVQLYHHHNLLYILYIYTEISLPSSTSLITML